MRGAFLWVFFLSKGLEDLCLTTWNFRATFRATFGPLGPPERANFDLLGTTVNLTVNG